MAIVREISRLLKQYNKLRQNEDENDSYEEEFDENLQHNNILAYMHISIVQRE